MARSECSLQYLNAAVAHSLAGCACIVIPENPTRGSAYPIDAYTIALHCACCAFPTPCADTAPSAHPTDTAGLPREDALVKSARYLREVRSCCWPIRQCRLIRHAPIHAKRRHTGVAWHYTAFADGCTSVGMRWQPLGESTDSRFEARAVLRPCRFTKMQVSNNVVSCVRLCDPTEPSGCMHRTPQLSLATRMKLSCSLLRSGHLYIIQ